MGHFVYEGKTNSAHTTGAPSSVATSPLHDISGRRKYLTRSERNAFLAAAAEMKPEVYTFCLTLAYTGARVSEVLSLTSRRIDIVARVVTIESLKKRRRGEFRFVPIPAELIKTLDSVHNISTSRRQSELADERLWKCCRTTAWNWTKACMEAANIGGLPASPKGLRHAFAVESLQAKVPLNLIQRWLGHSRLETTARYAEAVGKEEQTIAKRFWATFGEAGHFHSST